MRIFLFQTVFIFIASFSYGQTYESTLIEINDYLKSRKNPLGPLEVSDGYLRIMIPSSKKYNSMPLDKMGRVYRMNHAKIGIECMGGVNCMRSGNSGRMQPAIPIVFIPESKDASWIISKLEQLIREIKSSNLAEANKKAESDIRDIVVQQSQATRVARSQNKSKQQYINQLISYLLQDRVLVNESYQGNGWYHRSYFTQEVNQIGNKLSCEAKDYSDRRSDKKVYGADSGPSGVLTFTIDFDELVGVSKDDFKIVVAFPKDRGNKKWTISWDYGKGGKIDLYNNNDRTYIQNVVSHIWVISNLL